MSTPIIKIKVFPKPVIKGKMDVRFPARVVAQSPVLLSSVGGSYTFSLDVNALGQSLAPSATIDTTNANNITGGSQTGTGAMVRAASPSLTGTPTAPTPAVDNSSTNIATTAYVQGQAGIATPAAPGTATVGTSKKWAHDDHVHPPPSVAQLTDTAWSTWSPTFSTTTVGSTGITAAISGTGARYKQVGKIVHFTLDFQISNIGSGNTGQVTFTLPITAFNASYVLVATGKEPINTGKLLAVQGNSTTTGGVIFYDNASAITLNNRFQLGGFYEAA